MVEKVCMKLQNKGIYLVISKKNNTFATGNILKSIGQDT